MSNERTFPRPNFESLDPLSTAITYLISFHYYQDAFDVAQLRANAIRCDFGIRKAYDLETCDVGQPHTKMGERIPKANYSIERLLPPKYRSGRDLTCQVVEPITMTDKEMRARGQLTEENFTETSRQRVGRTVIVKGTRDDGTPTTIHKPASVADLHIPHTVTKETRP